MEMGLFLPINCRRTVLVVCDVCKRRQVGQTLEAAGGRLEGEFVRRSGSIADLSKVPQPSAAFCSAVAFSGSLFVFKQTKTINHTACCHCSRNPALSSAPVEQLDSLLQFGLQNAFPN